MGACAPTRPAPPGVPPSTGPGRGERVRSVLLVVTAALAGGLLGVLAVAPPLRRRRRRRARACEVCRRHATWWRAAAAVVAVLTLAGTGLRLAQDASALPDCPTAESITSGGYRVGVQPPRHESWWVRVRSTVTAPESGLAVAWARSRGETMCGVGRPSMTLAFVPEARSLGGSMVGDVFLTGVRPELTHDQAVALAHHESRHTDQWAVLTLVGGILLLPAGYLVDESMWPGAANHFEQSAGLAGGGYPPAPDPAAPPRAPALAVWALVALLLVRTRARMLCRAAARRGWTHSPGRCARHTPGWW